VTLPESIQVLALPFAACLILTGIHAYLGIHVLSRKVIFVDIALAQIAALGATVAFLLGYDPRSEGAYWFSLGFAVLAAAVFALTRTRQERVPQEAVIGLTYAVASAIAILLADASPHGAEHLKDLMAGSIVWVTPHQVIKTGLLYAAIGAFHYIFRRTFLLISLDPDRAYAEGIRVRLWDFLFYLSFGVVITSSVQIAGVLLVFCYLVAPAVFAVMFADGLRTRLALGWGLGAIVSAAGLLMSYDRPSGPMLMVCFAVALGLGGAIRSLRGVSPTTRTVALSGIAAGVILVIAWLAGRPAPLPDADHRHGDAGSEHALEAARERAEAHDIGQGLPDLRLALSDSHPAVRAEAAGQLARRGDLEAVPAIIEALGDESTAVRESAARALGQLGDPRGAGALMDALHRPGEDEWVRLREAEAACLLGSAGGIPVLLELARSGEARMLRREALEIAARLAGLPAGAAAADPGGVQGRLGTWWKLHGAGLQRDPADGTFVPHADDGSAGRR
jgi:zinc/manganese transport system permease protein